MAMPPPPPHPGSLAGAGGGSGDDGDDGRGRDRDFGWCSQDVEQIKRPKRPNNLEQLDRSMRSDQSQGERQEVQTCHDIADNRDIVHPQTMQPFPRTKLEDYGPQNAANPDFTTRPKVQTRRPQNKPTMNIPNVTNDKNLPVPVYQLPRQQQNPSQYLQQLSEGLFPGLRSQNPPMFQYDLSMFPIPEEHPHYQVRPPSNQNNMQPYYQVPPSNQNNMHPHYQGHPSNQNYVLHHSQGPPSNQTNSSGGSGSQSRGSRQHQNSEISSSSSLSISSRPQQPSFSPMANVPTVHPHSIEPPSNQNYSSSSQVSQNPNNQQLRGQKRSNPFSQDARESESASRRARGNVLNHDPASSAFRRAQPSSTVPSSSEPNSSNRNFERHFHSLAPPIQTNQQLPTEPSDQGNAEDQIPYEQLRLPYYNFLLTKEEEERNRKGRGK